MKILFTGASSFTGLWFIEELVRCGHEVGALFRGQKSSYEGLRRERVDLVCAAATQSEFDCSFGSERFLRLLDGSWDLLCHHAAETTNYKSADFDVLKAVASNTNGLREVLRRGIKRVVLTGSVFAPGEGLGSEELRAFSPYGVSKGFTTQLFEYYCGEAGVELSRFVIPNPFGPFEEPRFVDYLVREWLHDRVAMVKTPLYVRDNIPVSLLAKAYVRHCESDEIESHPSGYVGSQSEFTERLARAMRSRLGVPCEYICAEQFSFDEPAVRVNTDIIECMDWDEEKAWDELASYYLRRYASVESL